MSDDELLDSRRYGLLLVRVIDRIDRLVKRIEELEKRMTDLENRADQLNPDHDAYEASRESEDEEED